MDPVRYRSLSFQPLKKQDLPLMYSWLQKPHVREFYHRRMSLPLKKRIGTTFRASIPGRLPSVS